MTPRPYTSATIERTHAGSKARCPYAHVPRLLRNQLREDMPRAAGMQVAQPEDACEPLAQSYAGQAVVLLVRRSDRMHSNCSFAAKVRMAQASGAAACLVYDRQPGGHLIAMSALPTLGPEPGIPSAFITFETGAPQWRIALDAHCRINMPCFTLCRQALRRLPKALSSQRRAKLTLMMLCRCGAAGRQCGRLACGGAVAPGVEHRRRWR